MHPSSRSTNQTRNRRDKNGEQKGDEEAGVSKYERSREERINQNLQRLQTLSILELSRNLKPPLKPKTVRLFKPKPLLASPRRSARIKILPTVSYSEKHGPKETVLKNVDTVIKICHQCRQKTTRLRTECCKCRSAQGQLCGGCLFKRYGENILEANANRDWVCPVCRDICNCSRCWKVKGWEPIGSIYNKALHLGYKSVAHYLLHTRGPHGKHV